MFKKLFSKLSSMFLSDDGVSWSSMRFNMLYTGILASTCVWGGLVAACILKKEVVDLPPGVQVVYLSIMGIVLGAKIAQSKLTENGKSTDDPEPK